jgi:hypothetical protein
MSQPRAIVLVELDFAEGMAYMSSEFYVSQPGDTPASKLYDARIDDIVYERSISCIIWRGTNRPPQPVRELRFLNSDGGITDWINYDIRDRAVTVKIAYADGNPSTSSWADIPLTAFDTIAVLRGDTVIADGEDSMRVTLRSWIDVLSETALANANQPFVVGEVSFVRPVIVDEDALQYAVLDRPYLNELVQLRQGGTPLVGGGTDYTATSTGFTLNDPPTGVLQAHVKGIEFIVGGAWVERIEDAIEYALEDGGDYPGLLDTVSLAALPNYKMCAVWYDQISRADFIQQCLDSINGFWWQAADGLLHFGVLAEPSGTPVLYITEDNIDGDLQVEPDLALGLTRTVYYNQNFAIATDVEAANAGAVGYREEAKRPYDFTVATSVPAGRYAPATNREPRRLLLANAADAEAVAEDSCALYTDTNAYFGRLTIFVPDGASAANAIEPNDVVHITHSRYGLSGSGTLARVVSASSSLFSQRLELILWWRL